MQNKACGARLFAVTFTMIAGAAAGQSPDGGQLARFKEKVRQDLTSIPNYTCLETIERAHREPHKHSFKPVDTVHLEVSNVYGKELFAWPGSRQFDDRGVASLVTSGMIGAGMFATFAQNLFVSGNGTLQYRDRESLGGRVAIRYDFHLTQQESRGEIRANGAAELVAANGSLWFDPVSLDLIRLDAYGEGIPYNLHLEEAVFRIFYARTHIGDADAMLPKRSELTMAYFSGEANRAAIEFTQCREYGSESTIRFDASPTLSEAPKPQVRQVDLPAGLLVPVELETGIDSKTASVGDTLHARVVEDVRFKGDLLVPRGAAITGHIRRLDRRTPYEAFAVGIEFSEVEWEGAHASFLAELVDLNRKSAGARWPRKDYDSHANKALIDNGSGVFFIGGTRFRIAAGFHMLWRTLASPGCAGAQAP